MVGSAVTGALVMAFGNELRAPHGGILVVAAGQQARSCTCSRSPSARSITAALVIVLMSLDKAKTEEIAHDEDVAEGVAA